MDKGCSNCYYEEFDKDAYPCSMCIRGAEREDKWQPRDRKDCAMCLHHEDCHYQDPKDIPWTDCGWK